MGTLIPRDATEAPWRPDRWLVAAVAAIVGSFLVLLYLDRTFTFWWDEWAFIRIPGLGTPQDWLTPHNEHWSTLPLLLYRATFLVVGLHSYLPYLAELLVLHAIAVGGLFALTRRDLWPAAALVAILPLLVLGSGFQDLMWAFQTGFVGSTAAGLWALYALDTPGRRGTVAGSLLLLTSLMCSGMGLFWLAAAAIELVLDPSRRRRLMAIGPPVAAYALWYVAFGAAGLARDQSLFTLHTLAGDVSYVAHGLRGVVVSFTGLGWIVSSIVIVGLFGYAGLRLASRSAPARLVAVLGAMVLMYATIGLVRGHIGGPERSRYTYVAVFFLMLALSSLLGQLRRESRFPPVIQAVVAGLVVACLVTNATALSRARATYAARAQDTRAYIAAALTYQGAPWVDPNGGWGRSSPMPTVAEVIDLVRRYGNPNVDTLAPWVVPHPSASARDHALTRLMGDNFRAEPGAVPTEPTALIVARMQHLELQPDGACVVASTTGSSGLIGVWVPGGGALTLTPSQSGTARARVRRSDDPLKLRYRSVRLTAGSTTDLQVPDTGDGPWQVVVELPPGSSQLCVAPPGG